MSNGTGLIKQLQDNRMLITPHGQTTERGVTQHRDVRESKTRQGCADKN